MNRKKDTLAKKEVAEKRGTWIDWEHLKTSGSTATAVLIDHDQFYCVSLISITS